VTAYTCPARVVATSGVPCRPATSCRTSAVAVPCGDVGCSVTTARSPARCTPLMHGAGRGQDVRVGCRGVHVGLVPKKVRYSLSLAQDAHPTPSPRLGAHLEDVRSRVHPCILVALSLRTICTFAGVVSVTLADARSPRPRAGLKGRLCRRRQTSSAPHAHGSDASNQEVRFSFDIAVIAKPHAHGSDGFKSDACVGFAARSPRPRAGRVQSRSEDRSSHPLPTPTGATFCSRRNLRKQRSAPHTHGRDSKGSEDFCGTFVRSPHPRARHWKTPGDTR
jgi:hypothetical protein